MRKLIYIMISIFVLVACTKVSTNDTLYDNNLAEKRERVSQSIYLVATIPKSYFKVYTNKQEQQIIVKGIDGLSIEQLDTKLEENGTRFILDYRGILSGEVDKKYEEELKAAGFTVETTDKGTVRIHSYIQGSFLFQSRN